MALDIAGFARVTMTWTGAGAPSGASVVWCVSNTTDLAPMQIGQAFETIWGTSGMDDQQTNDVVLSSVLVKLSPDETGASGLESANVPGTQNVTSMPPNVSFLVHKNTADGGRRGRGRAFIPGVPEASVDDSGVVAGAVITAISSALTSFRTTLEASDLPLFLEHDRSYTWIIDGGQPRRVPSGPAAPVPTPITTLSLDSRVATQRRRLRR